MSSREWVNLVPRRQVDDNAHDNTLRVKSLHSEQGISPQRHGDTEKINLKTLCLCVSVFQSLFGSGLSRLGYKEKITC